MIVHRGTAAAVVCAAVVLAGCSSGNGDDPTVLPSGGTTPTSTASASASSPAPIPTGPGRAAAIAAARGYYARVNVAAHGGDLAALEAASTPDCACRAQVRFLRNQLSRGRIEGSVYTVTGAELALFKAGDSANVVVYFELSRGRLVDRAGKTVDTYSAVRGGTSAVTVVYVGKTWKVRGIRGINP